MPALNTAWTSRQGGGYISGRRAMILLGLTVETIPILLESDDACEGNGVLSM